MTTILCYGDSNTYGYNPVNGLRYTLDRSVADNAWRRVCGNRRRL